MNMPDARKPSMGIYISTKDGAQIAPLFDFAETLKDREIISKLMHCGTIIGGGDRPSFFNELAHSDLLAMVSSQALLAGDYYNKVLRGILHRRKSEHIITANLDYHINLDPTLNRTMVPQNKPIRGYNPRKNGWEKVFKAIRAKLDQLTDEEGFLK